jgi:hypothetical protein
VGSFYGLSKYFHYGIIDKAKELGYDESNILLLSGEETLLKKRYPKVYNRLLSCVHQRDSRTPFEYGRDLVASWVFEDCVIQSLQDSGLDVKHNGADKNRKILQDEQVMSDSDAVIHINGKDIPIEIMCDYTGFWSHHGIIDLRDNKYQKLKKTNSLFLGFSTTDDILITIDFSKEIKVNYIQSHKPYGGKSCRSVILQPEYVRTFTKQAVVDSVKEMCFNK